MNLILVGVVCVAIFGAYVGGQFRGYLKEHDVRVKEVAKITSDIESEREVWTDMMVDLGSELTADGNKIQQELQTNLDSASGQLADAIERLSKRPSSATPSPTKPANTAPAECRTFEAAPGLLPQRDRELFLRLGDAANRVVLERNALSAHYESARKVVEAAAARAKERGN